MDPDIEVTEQLILAELTGVIDPDVLNLEGKDAQVLNIKSDKPALRIGPYLFSGEYSLPNGTNLLLEDKNQDDSEEKKLEYFATVKKNLTLCAAFVRDRQSQSSATESTIEASITPSEAAPSSDSIPQNT